MQDMAYLSGSTAIDGVDRLPSGTRARRVPAQASGFDAPGELMLDGLDDRQLVQQCVDGNHAAFDQLVLRYRDKVLRLVTSVLGRNADVEDVTQEIFIKIFLSLERFRGEATFSTYLYTATVNRCRDELRRSKLRRLFSFDDWFASRNDQPSYESELSIETLERRDAVRAAMKLLPVGTQMLLYLREVEGLSYKELADVFDTQIGTIKSRLARSRDKLRERLVPFVRDGHMPREDSHLHEA